MEDNRNESGKNLRLKKFLRLPRFFFGLSFLLGVLAGLCLIASLTLPDWLFRTHPPGQGEVLRAKERSLQNRFASLRANLVQRGRTLSLSLPHELEAIRRSVLSLRLDLEKEGVAYLKGESLLFWYGQIVPPSLLPPADQITHVVRYRSSVFLTVVFPVRKEERLAFFRLLSYRPLFSTPFLRSYQFLEDKEKENVLVDYYEDSDDVSGFEKIFSRHRDEYISQPRSRLDILTIFFPLRNEAQRLLATVNLRSPAPAAIIEAQKRSWQKAGWLTLLAAFLSLTSGGFVLWRKTGFRGLGPLFLCLAGLVGFRLTSLKMSLLGGFTAAVFAPSMASLPSPAGLLASPLDLFLTFLFLFLMIALLIIDRRHLLFSWQNQPSSALRVVAALGFSLTSFLPFLGFYAVSRAVNVNSNIHLLRFSPFLPSILLFGGLFFLLATATLGSFLLWRMAQNLWPGLPRLVLGLVSLGLLSLSLPFFFPEISLPNGLLLSLPLLGFYLYLSLPRFQRKPLFRWLALALTIGFFHLTLHFNIRLKETQLTENFLRESVLAQAEWAEYLLRDSLPNLDQEKETIRRFLKRGLEGNLASFLWEKTSLARSNWYSSLEILDPAGRLLSRFSLNLPLFFRPTPLLPTSPEWSLLRLTLPFPGREKTFLVAYQDFSEGEILLGRLIIFALLDEEMLPFLYSAVPYFDLLRFPSVPSLKEFRFGLASFRADGQAVFNPARLTTGIPAQDWQRLQSNPETAFWSSRQDRGRSFRVFYFWNQDKVIAIFWPKARLITLVVEYLKILFPLLALIYIPLWLTDILSRRRLVSIFWAFSSRVYASFVAIILILLIPFTVLIQNFFNRMASERFSEKAEIQARIARNIIEDFLFFQEEEATPPISLEDLVLWVSTAIANDVNIYQQGRLMASSRQEFFESGVLPDYLDGEVAYRLLQEKQPYLVWHKKIGGYSFQTLTLPLNLESSLYLIALPFPLERQEIARSQEELFEFLSFISALSLIAVLLFARSIGSLVITPIKQLLTATREVSAGNLDVFIAHRGRDEIQTLIDGFNRMVKSLKQHQQELAEMSKKAAWAEMARKVAHEVKNPLTPIRLSAEHLLRVYEERPEELASALRESVTYIISEVENLRQIAQDFLAFSREGRLERTSFELGPLLREITLPYERVLSSRITFDFDFPPDLKINGDRDKLKTALRNLITNAVEAIKGKGKIIVAAKETESGLLINISDTGEGMDAITLQRVFEPDFSTKDLGTGLGLPIAKKIIEDHGGSIEIFSQLKQGTQVKVFLPRGEITSE